jgi:tryptophanyl-tRNA synthetase
VVEASVANKSKDASPWGATEHGKTEPRKDRLLTAETKTKRVVSGMRPTGRLHIGHYFGALQNWVRLQNDPEFDCFYFIADWHALTSDYADSSQIAQNAIEIVTDYLAAGLDPQKSVIFQQSLIPEHAELHLLLSMVTPLSWLERVPTYKEAFENVKDKDLHTYGFLGYPCLQAADIVIYSKEGMTLVVPVGEDQVSHVEITREIVRRFDEMFAFGIGDDVFDEQNKKRLETILRSTGIMATALHWSYPFSVEDRARFKSAIIQKIRERGIMNYFDLYPAQRDWFRNEPLLNEPDSMLTKTPRIPGLDGRKMSKSYGNTITLSESDVNIRAKTKVMVTDPARKRRSDPGNPDVCPVYDWHRLFSPQQTLDWAAQGCRTAGIGCIECKAKMADHMIQWLDREGIRERRRYYEQRPGEVKNIVREGSVKARLAAQETMMAVRDAVFGRKRTKRRTIRKSERTR